MQRMETVPSQQIKDARFAPSGAAFLRTPLLPLAEILDFSTGLLTPAALEAGTCTPEIYARDRQLLRQRLMDRLARPEFCEAVFLGSPDLEDRISVYVAKPERDEGQRIERALYKYFARMASRPTPFGVFAGCSAVPYGRETDLALAPFASYRRRSRLDMNFVSELAMNLEKDAGIKDELRFFPNPSIYSAAGRTRYVEARMADNRRLHHLVAIERNEFLDFALARAQDGATPAELAAAIAAYDAEIELAQAREFVDELIASQLLVSEISLNVTGPEVVPRMLDKLAACRNAQDMASVLRSAELTLKDIDQRPLGLEPSAYRELAKRLEPLPAKVDLKTLIQVDLLKPAPEASLGQSVLKEVLRGVELLHKIGPWAPFPSLTRFKEDFRRRYEDQDVPLLQALDEDVGIGFEKSSSPGAEDSPLLAGMNLAGAAKPNARAADSRVPVLLRILARALRDGALEIELTDDDVKDLTTTDPSPLPDSMDVMFTIAAADRQRLAQGDFRILLLHVGGPPGSRMLGRFCHLDPAMEAAVREHVRQEEALRPAAIFAEIIHLPEGRIGNILFRPILREHELTILGYSTLPREAQIPLTDLMVGVRGERIVLRSRRLNREIVPRLSSAHNYSGIGIGIYKFLCSLQSQGVAASRSWVWGALDESPFLPRVVHGKFVLACATWKIFARDVEGWGKDDGLRGFEAFQAWRAANRLPRRCELVQSDNTLYLDLDNPLSVDTLLDMARKYKGCVLREIYPGPDELVAHGPEGVFTHEIIMPIIRLPSEQKTTGASPEGGSADPPAASPSQAVRVKIPGSEWLFAKLYCGSSDADHVLREVVAPLAAAAQQSGWTDRWFFIRYADPDWHLRLRFRGDPSLLTAKLLPALHDLVGRPLADGRLHSLVLDAYNPEIERYGGALGIEDVEQYFCADSEAALRIVQRIQGDTGQDDRWRLTLLGLDMLLEDFGLDPAARLLLMEGQAESFGAEFEFKKQLAKQLGQKFRDERAALADLLAGGAPAGGVLAQGREIFLSRRELAAQSVASLQQKEQAGQLAPPLAHILGSLCHMHANRLLRSAARAQEAVIYQLLARLYRMRVARAGS